MPKGKYTVVYEKDGAKYKLCKIWYGSDGSYYVTSPYHPAQKALLMKVTVNYARSEMQVPFEEALDFASAEDDDKRLKLAHHPDGLVQFSGEGILSGVDADGHIRGVGVRSWPLDNPVSGPAFGVVIRGVEEFERADRIRDELCLFTDAEVFLEPGADLLSLGGYYFPPLWRRFVRPGVDGTPTISVVHPAGAMLRLKVLLPPERCERQGFIGLELYGYPGDPETPSPSFMMSSATGNLRQNERGETLADGVYCGYPRGPVRTRRVVDYIMPAVPPQPHPASGTESAGQGEHGPA